MNPKQHIRDFCPRGLSGQLNQQLKKKRNRFVILPPSGQMKQRQPWKTFFFCQPAGGSSVLGVITHPFLQRRMIGGEKPAKGRVTCMDIKKRFCYVLVKQSF